jgi:hypothetical protein
MAPNHMMCIPRSILLDQDIKGSAYNMMYDAFKEREQLERYPMPGEDRLAKADRLHLEGPTALRAIEEEVQVRLWDANKLE